MIAAPCTQPQSTSQQQHQQNKHHKLPSGRTVPHKTGTAADRSSLSNICHRLQTSRSQRLQEQHILRSVGNGDHKNIPTTLETLGLYLWRRCSHRYVANAGWTTCSAVWRKSCHLLRRFASQLLSWLLSYSLYLRKTLRSVRTGQCREELPLLATLSWCADGDDDGWGCPHRRQHR